MDYDWQKFLNHLNAEYKDIGVDNPPVQVYDTSGNRYKVVHIYNDDGIICIDVEKVPFDE